MKPAERMAAHERRAIADSRFSDELLRIEIADRRKRDADKAEGSKTYRVVPNEEAKRRILRRLGLLDEEI